MKLGGQGVDVKKFGVKLYIGLDWSVGCLMMMFM